MIKSELKKFIDSKEHYKPDLMKVLGFGVEFELKKPGYLEVYPKEFIAKVDYESYQFGKKTIVGGEMGSQGRSKVDFITHDSRHETYLHSVGIDDFIKMVLADKIIFKS